MVIKWILALCLLGFSSCSSVSGLLSSKGSKRGMTVTLVVVKIPIGPIDEKGDGEQFTVEEENKLESSQRYNQ